ncbi:uncharacterized protein LOC124160487 [Ischnura elegans]|uniref:uncharacterized protein LOC124160487 n=1 Tax=Ischnura elegans TaxID=197161 RepID=UPI001ED87198|nr:uncharacterized protein LOC124160487 [Ischnura elegans]
MDFDDFWDHKKPDKRCCCCPKTEKEEEEKVEKEQVEVQTEGSLGSYPMRWEKIRGPRMCIPAIHLHPRMPPIREEGVDELGRLCEGEGEDPDGARWLRAIGRLYEGDQPEIPGWLFSRTRTPGSPP